MKYTAFYLLLILLCPFKICAARIAPSNTGSGSVPAYDLSIKLLPAAHLLEVTGTLYLPPTSFPRQSLKLILSDTMRNLQVEVLEPQASAGSARLEQKQPAGESITWEVHPAKTIPANETVRLRFSYKGGEATRFVFYIGAEGSFAGGNSTAWYPQIERDARATGLLRFSVPADYKVFATGIEAREKSAVQKAAGANFTFAITRPSYFSFASARYTVEHRRSRGRLSTSAYLLRPRPGIRDFLDGCGRVLDALTIEFGPNPYGDFALVEVPSQQAQQARFDGASGEGFIFSNANYLDADFNVAYYGHEIAHQWWGVAIGRKWWESGRGRLMLDEAMAQYGSLRAVEMIEGTGAAERYRRTGHPGYMDLHNADGYFMVEAGGFDHKLSELPEGDISRIIADSKGFIVYDMLSRTIGRENFRRILRGITRRYAFKNLSWEEFLRAVSTGAGKDLNWFYGQWFERAGAPEWKLEWHQKGNYLTGVISQSPPYYRAVVELAVKGDAHKKIAWPVELHGPQTVFRFPINFTARSATVDPHFLVLHRTQEHRALRPAMGAYMRSMIERGRGRFDEAERILRDTLAQETAPDLYGARFTLELGLGQLLLSQNRFPEAREHLEIALSSPSRRTHVLPWAYFYLARAAKELKDETTLRRAVENVITTDAMLGGRTGVPRELSAILPTNSPNR